MRRYYNKGSLVGGQVKLDKMGNNDGKISGEDFAVMRSRKMGGGMMKRPMYKKGSRVIPQDFMDTFIADDARSVAGKSGGADSGKAGEIRSKLGKSDVKFKKDIKNKIKKTKETIKKFAKKTKDTLKAPIIAFHKKAEENYKKYPDRRVRIYKDPSDKTDRSKKMGGGMMEEAKEINSKIKNSRTLKMGGGMMKRPMYKEGSPKPKKIGNYTFKSDKERADYTKQVKASLDGIMESFKDKQTPMKKQRLLDRLKKMGGGMMKRNMYKAGGSDASKFHTKKDGTKARKGLYYYMNRAKKKGTSKPGKGTVTDKALKASAKTAKKPTKKA